MRRGLVIGRFMPLHKGHIGLVHFAAMQCDELIVSMTYKPDDLIPGSLRLSWMEEEFGRFPAIRVESSLDDFDPEDRSWSERIPRWVSFLKNRFPPVDVLFSSEQYGQLLAEALEIPHIAFDLERKKIPVSASMIRERPIRNWDFIATSAKPYFVRKFCFYGPESTGKTTMARRLADLYHTEFVPEVAREFISSNDFTLDDIVHIGREQTKRVLDRTKYANRFLFCDTDVITTQVYSRHYLNAVPEELFLLEKQTHYDRYFLFGIDVPWVADGLRDLGHLREEMFNVFRNELEIRAIPYSRINGSFGDRRDMLIREIDSFF